MSECGKKHKACIIHIERNLGFILYILGIKIVQAVIWRILLSQTSSVS